MGLWQRIKDFIAQPDPLDVDSYLAPDSNPPPPSTMFVPDEHDNEPGDATIFQGSDD